MKTKNITNLYFNKASYFISDNSGNKIVMNINYFKNKFNLEIKLKKNDNISLLEAEVKDLATDLLTRKSGINFAEQ